jgi:DNA/RNA endonuclease G (NUC1)
MPPMIVFLPMRDSIRNLLIALCQISSVMAVSAFVQAQDVVVTHCDGSCPQYQTNMTATRANVVIHHVYAAGINGDTGLADWVSYRLTEDAIGVASLLPRIWQPDRLMEFSGVEDVLEIGSSELRLAEIAVSNNPYGGITELPEENNDSARLAPITSFANTPYWSDLNNLTNMVPMPKSLRLGPWLQLEQQLNALVAKKDALQVISGPLFLISNLTTTPTATAIEPAAYYKIVAHENEFAAFVFPKELGQFDSFCGQTSDIEQLQEMVSINFFPDRNMTHSAQLLSELNCSK